MIDDPRPRRKAFGPLFYSTSIVAVVLVSIQGTVAIYGSIVDRLRERSETAAFRKLMDETHNKTVLIRVRAVRSLIEKAIRVQALPEGQGISQVLVPVSLAGSIDRYEIVRSEAAYGLGVAIAISPRTPPGTRAPTPADWEACFQALRRLLNDPYDSVRYTAMSGIASFATARGAADFEDRAAVIDSLRAALSDADSDVRVVAARAVLSLAGGRDQAAVEALVAVLSDPKQIDDRHLALSELLAQGEGRRALKALTTRSFFVAADPYVLADVLSCFEEIGPEAVAAVPILEPLLDDENPDVRTGAGEAIVTIEGRSTTRSLTVSVKAVADQELPMDWRIVSAETALSIDPAALSTAAGELMKQLASDDPIVRRNAVGLLSMLVDLVRPEPPKPRNPDAPGEGPS